MMSLKNGFLPKISWMLWVLFICNSGWNPQVRWPSLFIWLSWKGFYCQPKKLGSQQYLMWVFWTCSSFFKITMMFNAQWVMDQSMDLNFMFRLWKKLSDNGLLCAWLFEFMKVTKLAVVQIMGFVKDEKTFSTLTFMNTRLWNRLCEHLDIVVRMFTQPFYIINTFPYDDAIITWPEEKTRRGLLAWCVLA